MSQLKVLDWNKKDLNRSCLDSSLFDEKINKTLIFQNVRWQRSKKRQGTHQAKTKGEVRGGGKKPFKQKGTGQARQGSIRSPLLRGGGVIFPPRFRDHSFSMPKKQRKKALKQALSSLYEKKSIYVVSEMSSKSGKTKDLFKQLKKFLKEENPKVLLVDLEKDQSFERVSKNLKKVCYYPLKALNVFDLLKYGKVIFTEKAANKLEENLKQVAKKSIQTKSPKKPARPKKVLKAKSPTQKRGPKK